MRTRQLVHLALCSGAFLAPAAHSTEPPPNLIECLPSRVYDCVANTDNCDSMPVSTVQGAYLLKVNLHEKRSETFEDEKKVSETRIDRIAQDEHLLFLYGFEIYENDQLPAHSWSAIINWQSGALTVTRISDGVAAVMHGSCKVGQRGAQ